MLQVYLHSSLTQKGKLFLLGRLVLRTLVGEPPKKQPTCDHINGDTRDNRLINLRWASQTKQLINQRKRVNHKNAAARQSKYRGVTAKRGNRWEVRLKLEGRLLFRKSFKDEKEAARFRRDYVINNNLDRDFIKGYEDVDDP